MKLLNISERSFMIKGEEKPLAPGQEIELKEEIAADLLASFPKEFKKIEASLADASEAELKKALDKKAKK